MGIRGGGGTRTVSRRGELATGGEAVGHEALEEDGVQVRTAKVDGGGVSGRARANDNLRAVRPQYLPRIHGPEALLTTLECILEDLGTVLEGAMGVIGGYPAGCWWRAAARGMALERDLNSCVLVASSVEDFIRTRWWSRTALAQLSQGA